MSHNVSYYWFGRTQYIPRFGGNLQECGDFTWRVSDCEELVGGLVTRNNGVKFIVGIAAYSIADCIS